MRPKVDTLIPLTHSPKNGKLQTRGSKGEQLTEIEKDGRRETTGKIPRQHRAVAKQEGPSISQRAVSSTRTHCKTISTD